MTLQQQAKYAPCPEGWSRFNFQHYKKFLYARAGKTWHQLKAAVKDLEQEKNYQRPTANV